MSHVIIRYKQENSGDWKTIVKCNTPDDEYNKMNDIFTFEIPALSEKTLVFEVILPNADKGGLKNRLKVK